MREFSMSLYNACADLLDRNIEAGRGDKIAFTDHVRSLTYAQLQADTYRFANLLRRLGIRREERILLLMTDTVEFPIAFLGAIRAGIIPVPVNTLLTCEQYAYMLEDSRARALFVSGSLLANVEPCLAAMHQLEHVIVVDGAPQPPRLDFASALAAEAADFLTVATHGDET